MGTVSPSVRSKPISSKPVISGSAISVTMTSGRCSRQRRSPTVASAASMTSCPLNASIRTTVQRTVASSSITRIRATNPAAVRLQSQEGYLIVGSRIVFR